MVIRSVGSAVPAVGEAISWAPPVQPHCPAGRLGYCTLLYTTAVDSPEHDWQNITLLFFEFHNMCVCVFCVLPESRCKKCNRAAESTSPGETNNIGQEHIEILSQICRTHQRWARYLLMCYGAVLELGLNAQSLGQLVAAVVLIVSVEGKANHAYLL